MPIAIPLPIAKGGTGQAATGTDAFSAGTSNTATGNTSCAVGGYNFSAGSFSNAFGYGCYGGGTNTSAFGYFVQSPVSNTAEFGYWPNQSSRGGAIRTDSSGMAALTYNTSSTTLTDGGATAGSEAAGTLPRGMCAVRHDGNGQTFLDVNDAGVVETKNISSVYGQATAGTGTVTIGAAGTYVQLTTAGTLDSGNTSNMALNSGQITLQNTSGYTRKFLVNAYIGTYATNASKTTIGLQIGKNGTPLTGSDARAFTDSDVHPAGITTSFIVTLDDDEYADIYVANHTDTDELTVSFARITAHSID